MSFVGDVGQGVGNSLIAAIPYAGLPAFFVGAAGGGISSAAEKTGDVGFYILIICDGEFGDIKTTVVFRFLGDDRCFCVVCNIISR